MPLENKGRNLPPRQTANRMGQRRPRPLSVEPVPVPKCPDAPADPHRVIHLVVAYGVGLLRQWLDEGRFVIVDGTLRVRKDTL